MTGDGTLDLPTVGIITPNLDHLTLRNSGIRSLSLRYLDHLKYLNISGSRENAVQAEVLVPALQQLTELETLVITLDVDSSSPFMALNELMDLSTLQELTLESLFSSKFYLLLYSIDSFFLIDSFVNGQAPLKNNTLKKLHLSNCEFTSGAVLGIKSFFEDPDTFLKILISENNTWRDDQLNMIIQAVAHSGIEQYSTRLLSQELFFISTITYRFNGLRITGDSLTDSHVRLLYDEMTKYENHTLAKFNLFCKYLKCRISVSGTAVTSFLFCF